MRRRIARVVLAVTLSAIGCAAQPRIAVRSQVAGVPAPLHRVKVYAPLVTGDVWNPVSQTMFDAFKASLELRLQLCRVSAEISREPPPEAGVAPAGPEPVASLGIEVAGKQIIDVHHSMNGAEYAVTYDGVLYLGLALTDGHAPAPVWVARTGFAFANAQLYSRIEIAEVDARSLARAIVGQLHRDGFLPGCIREAYLGCTADRREGHLSAARIADDRERFIANRDLPDCK